MADLQKLKALLSRLARRKSLLVTVVFGVLTYGSKFFGWGVAAIDWAERYSFIADNQSRVFDALKWVVSPTGSSLLFGFALIAFFVAVILTVNPKEKPAAAPLQIAPEKPKPKLDFVIDQESHVNVQRGGSHVSRITADIKLRCEKTANDVMVVRSFRLSLHRVDADGKVTTIPYQKEAQVVFDDSKGKLLHPSDGWTIDKDTPRSEYRWYSFTIEITPQAQAELSSDHFLQLTMDAIGQDAISKAVYVKDWSEGFYSPISLEPFEVFPLAAQEEIKELKGELKGYETTIGRLGEKAKEYQEKIKELDRIRSASDKKVEDLENKIGELNSNLESLNRERSRPDQQRLQIIADQDKRDIQDSVIVKGIQFRNEIDYGMRYIHFVFTIFNQSIYEITIDNSLGDGDIIFDGQPKVVPMRLHDADVKLFEKAAKASKQNLSEWMRDSLRRIATTDV